MKSKYINCAVHTAVVRMLRFLWYFNNDEFEVVISVAKILDLSRGYLLWCKCAGTIAHEGNWNYESSHVSTEECSFSVSAVLTYNTLIWPMQSMMKLDIEVKTPLFKIA